MFSQDLKLLADFVANVEVELHEFVHAIQVQNAVSMEASAPACERTGVRGKLR
jgi:hypothetical protein